MTNEQLRETIKRLVDDITDLTLAVLIKDEEKEKTGESNEEIQNETTDPARNEVSTESVSRDE
jgi:hypothetical protein|tara:strand:+ start:64 stop:252 length:189 start_codon:yes stop_codon:yes gene_type:complete